MKYKIQWTAILFLISVLAACSGGSDNKEPVVEPPIDPPVQQKTNAERINELWPQTAEQLLSQDLWVARDKYDTAHALMLPMRYAFSNNDSEKINQFNAFFTRLDSAFDQGISDNRVSTNQFMYFVSEYLVLLQNSGNFDATALSLHEKLKAWWLQFVDGPAWMWDREPFDNLVERLSWKLSDQTPGLPYYKAMFDEDLYILATMSNLSYLDKAVAESETNTEFAQRVTELTPLLTQMLQTQVTFLNPEDTNNQQWLFQKGVWSEHRDYAYAGNLALADNLEKQIVEGIAVDSSHSHRWPLWLASYARSYSENQDMQDYLTRLTTGLAQQFNQVVYVKLEQGVTTPRLSNYFDGHNGVYRYQFATAGNSGYGPYQLSQILYVGWYGALTEAEQYKADLESVLANGGLQLSDADITLLTGPNTSRERNPMFVLPDYFNNGMAEFNLRISLALLN